MTRILSPFLQNEQDFKNLVQTFIQENNHRLHAHSTVKGYRQITFDFKCWMLESGVTQADECVVKQWLLDRIHSVSETTLSIQTCRLNLFFRFLVKCELVKFNPFQTLREQHRSLGFRGIARAIKEANSPDILDCLADRYFSGPLSEAFLDYIKYLEALGRQSESPRRILEAFELFLREKNVKSWDDVSTKLILQWQTWMNTTSEDQAHRHISTLNRFLVFLLGQQVIQTSPMPEVPAFRRKCKPPHVFSRDEVKRILDLVEKLPDSRQMPYRGSTYRLVYLLLYALGLRINEALNLRIRDIDFKEDSIAIVKTKFNKGRVLPFGPRIKARLIKHMKEHPLLKLADDDAYLFQTSSHQGPHLSGVTCFTTLSKITKELGIVHGEGTRPPNHHSFRFSFAVHRLERWLREGADLEVKLPLLSAFMGHVDIAATQVYLTMTPERLRLLNERFENAFGKER